MKVLPLRFNYMLILALLASVSCDVSSISEEELDDLSIIGARIDIYQDPYNKNNNHMTVRLLDKKNKQLRSENVKILINGSEMIYRESQELYYTHNIRYRTENLSISDGYYFEIKFLNGNTAPLGYMRALTTVNEANISFPEKISLENTEIALSWNNLEELNELTIQKDLIDPTYDSTTYHLTKYIDPAGGNFVINDSFIANSKGNLDGISWKLSKTKEGLLNQKLLDFSYIRLTSAIEGYIVIQ